MLISFPQQALSDFTKKTRFKFRKKKKLKLFPPGTLKQETNPRYKSV